MIAVIATVVIGGAGLLAVFFFNAAFAFLVGRHTIKWAVPRIVRWARALEKDDR